MQENTCNRRSGFLASKIGPKVRRDSFGDESASSRRQHRRARFKSPARSLRHDIFCARNDARITASRRRDGRPAASTERAIARRLCVAVRILKALEILGFVIRAIHKDGQATSGGKARIVSTRRCVSGTERRDDNHVSTACVIASTEPRSASVTTPPIASKRCAKAARYPRRRTLKMIPRRSRPTKKNCPRYIFFARSTPSDAF